MSKKRIVLVEDEFGQELGRVYTIAKSLQQGGQTQVELFPMMDFRQCWNIIMQALPF